MNVSADAPSPTPPTWPCSWSTCPRCSASNGRPTQPDFSVLDLKAHFRGLKYVAETLKLLPQKPEPIVIQQITVKIALLGAINAT